MATSKGKSRYPLEVNKTDSVHVIDDGQVVWLQLRRNVPSAHDFAKPSFKSAVCLPLDLAEKLGNQLLKIIHQKKGKPKSKQQPATSAVQLRSAPAPQ
jgi:hypothetical protein